MNFFRTSMLSTFQASIVKIIDVPMWFQRTFGVSSLQKKDEDDFRKLASAIYLQVSTISQALIFVTRSRSWSFVERPGLLLVAAFIVAQLVSELLDSSHILRSDFWYPWFINHHKWTDCYTDCCLCKLEFCCNRRNWLGLGWCGLALQPRLLFPTWHNQVCNQICH